MQQVSTQAPCRKRQSVAAVLPPGQLVRQRVMREAHTQWRYCRMKGWHVASDDPWTWARCLRWAWAAERLRCGGVAH